ncbi:MAG: 50S ribosome-binding GTPase [Oscillospiraceae bacterium]|nr:50S ribosome-binding GTPase [Oscillospiraceae bacterium]
MKRSRSNNAAGAPRASVALGGNPNVGKSTVFNALTGLRQHTGNWAGKTVAVARGAYTYRRRRYAVVDLPGTYSLSARSAEEEVARDFLLSGQADAAVIVCDATCLERSLRLVYQTMALTRRVIVCVNLLDEARRLGLCPDLAALGRRLGVPVVGMSARTGEGVGALMEAVRAVTEGEIVPAPVLPALPPGPEDERARALAAAAEEAARVCLPVCPDPSGHRLRRRLDTLFMGRRTGAALMLALLCLVFWITLAGANVPSRLLGTLLLSAQEPLRAGLAALGAPLWLCEALTAGVWRTLAWVVSVMLPPMAIFFPLFTLLEDFGYLPRAAFTLDRHFCRAKACGKQALTMCMGWPDLFGGYRAAPSTARMTLSVHSSNTGSGVCMNSLAR